MRRIAVAFYVVVALLSVATAPIQPDEANAFDAGSVALANQLAADLSQVSGAWSD